jgi:NADH-quinone oxidoreductase subunit N
VNLPWIELSPLLVLFVAPLCLIVLAAFRRGPTLSSGVASLTLIVSLVGVVSTWSQTPATAAPLFVIDSFARIVLVLILVSTLGVVLISHRYWAVRLDSDPSAALRLPSGEYYLLLLCATLGAAVLVISNHFISFFLGLEILSISLYALIAFDRGLDGIEAGIKYLVLASAAAGMLLLGMAFLYAATGSLSFSALSAADLDRGDSRALAMVGLGLFAAGIAFKLALAPFHLWTADVYQGAPAPVTLFIATVSKGAALAVLIRFSAALPGEWRESLAPVWAALAVFSMFLGNWLALLQSNVKRLLAYSSIAHLGYVLIAFAAPASTRGMAAAAFYTVAYVLTSLGTFGAVALASSASREAKHIQDYAGLANRRPVFAAAFLLALFSLAGLPLTAGFVGKIFIASSGLEGERWGLVICLVANSALSAFYYLRLAWAILRDRDESDGESLILPPLSWRGIAVIGGVCVALTVLGVFPGGLLELLQAALGTS